MHFQIWLSFGDYHETYIISEDLYGIYLSIYQSYIYIYIYIYIYRERERERYDQTRYEQIGTIRMRLIHTNRK